MYIWKLPVKFCICVSFACSREQAAWSWCKSFTAVNWMVLGRAVPHLLALCFRAQARSKAFTINIWQHISCYLEHIQHTHSLVAHIACHQSINTLTPVITATLLKKSQKQSHLSASPFSRVAKHFQDRFSIYACPPTALLLPVAPPPTPAATSSAAFPFPTPALALLTIIVPPSPVPVPPPAPP